MSTHANASTHPAVALTEQLIARESVTPEDAGCQQIIASRLEPLGFHCEHLRFGDPTAPTDNLWARRGSEGPVLCFAGHTDVVPTGPVDQWQYPPFEPTTVDGVMYGRGAADMKASLAAMVVAAERFVADYPEASGSLSMLITSDEEGPARDGTLKVMQTLSERGETIDWCVVGEPSSQDALGDLIRIGRRGSLSGMLTLKGVQGHVAYPQLAHNPIEDLAVVLQALYAMPLDDGNEHFPPTSFQFVHVDAGTGAPNVTPGSCFARFNFRYSTEWHHQQLRDAVTEVLESLGVDYELKWHLSGEPFLTEPGVLTDAVSRAITKHTGLSTELSTGGGTSDGRFIAPTGTHVIELGPINASIHKVNEHVRIDDVAVLSDIYYDITTSLLLEA
ncbi:MAG: succinyl-diaminopimelate desuccinylase [Pseudomonadota bacterium]